MQAITFFQNIRTFVLCPEDTNVYGVSLVYLVILGMLRILYGKGSKYSAGSEFRIF
jgi:uncharacterized membrane protein